MFADEMALNPPKSILGRIIWIASCFRYFPSGFPAEELIAHNIPSPLTKNKKGCLSHNNGVIAVVPVDAYIVQFSTPVSGLSDVMTGKRSPMSAAGLGFGVLLVLNGPVSPKVIPYFMESRADIFVILTIEHSKSTYYLTAVGGMPVENSEIIPDC